MTWTKRVKKCRRLDDPLTRRRFIRASAGAAASLGMGAFQGCDRGQRAPTSGDGEQASRAQGQGAQPTNAQPQTAAEAADAVSVSGPSPHPGLATATHHDGAYNILLFVTDQERYFERWPFSVPGRERLRELGVSFDNHQICSNVCSPSRSVLYTGRHIQHTGVFDNVNTPWQRSMSDRIPTLGHLMREAGYYTAFKGKWHLAVELEEGNDLEAPHQLLTSVMERYGFADYYGIGDIIGNTRGGYLHDEIITAMTVRWLRNKGRSFAELGKPWFLAVNLVNPHDVMYLDTDLPGAPVQKAGDPVMRILPPPDVPHYRASWDVPLPDSRHQPFDAAGRPAAHRDFQAARGVLLGNWPDEDRRWRVLQDYYFNCIRDSDRHLTRVLAELQDQDLLRRTIIVFTSDHGELAGAHQMHGKGACAYREQNHVPLVVVHPEVRGGQRCKALTSHLDIAPTILGFTGANSQTQSESRRALKGKDFSKLLAAAAEANVNAVRDATLFNYNMFGYLDGDFLLSLKALRDAERLRKVKQGVAAIKRSKPALSKRGAIRSLFDGRYRLSRYFSPTQHHTPADLDALMANNDVELYDLETDPHELDNLAIAPDKEANAALLAKLNARLNELIAQEVGVDDGSMLPLSALTSWNLEGVDV